MVGSSPPHVAAADRDGGLLMPSVEASASARSARLAARIGAQIDAAGGAIPFFDYMELALYAPGLGYYTAGAPKFGAEGDFVTAPELGSLFAHTLANTLTPLLRAVDRPRILEVGGGSGRLAVDLLQALRAQGVMPDYALLEISADLRARQRARLAAHGLEDRVAWLDQPPGAPWQGVVLANEVLDALPVERFEIDAGGQPQRLGVCRVGEGFGWTPIDWLPGQRALLDACLPSAQRPAGYRSEFRPQLEGWLARLSAGLERGLMLFIDYGYPAAEYFHPERRQGTLACHHRHQIDDDPFSLPGLKDISASVDFSALARAGRALGLELYGYTSQARWLLAAGLPEQLATCLAKTPERALALSAEVRRLILPEGMGERFQMLALARGPVPALPGFAGPDLRHRL